MKEKSVDEILDYVFEAGLTGRSGTGKAVIIKQAKQQMGEVFDEDEIGFTMYKTWNNSIDEKTLRENWTAKHFRADSKTMCGQLANAVVKFLKSGFNLEAK